MGVSPAAAAAAAATALDAADPASWQLARHCWNRPPLRCIATAILGSTLQSAQKRLSW